MATAVKIHQNDRFVASADRASSADLSDDAGRPSDVEPTLLEGVTQVFRGICGNVTKEAALDDRPDFLRGGGGARHAHEHRHYKEEKCPERSQAEQVSELRAAFETQFLTEHNREHPRARSGRTAC